MHILIAPNAFKNSLDASAVAAAIAEGLQQSKLNCSFECFPIGDGGDGTAALIIKKQNGTVQKVEAHDASGRKIESSFGLIDDGKTTAVIELADASGIKFLAQHELDPLHASTFGTGELIKQALDKGVSKIIMCIGGSATVDGGTGILEALGIRFLNEDKTLEGLPESLVNLTTIDLSNFDKRILNCELIILCDVKNKLLGENGAAKIFGPQKGASNEDVNTLEKALTKLRDVALMQTGLDMAVIEHGGATGGVAAGLAAFCNAKLVDGIDHFLTLTSFDEALQKADLVITGEGSIDAQTLEGKGPYGVALKAKEKNIPVIGIGGKVPLTTGRDLEEYFQALLSINNEPAEISEAIKNTKRNLIRTGKVIGDLLMVQTHLK